MFARVSAYHADEDSEKLIGAFQETIGPLQQVEGFRMPIASSTRTRAGPSR